MGTFFWAVLGTLWALVGTFLSMVLGTCKQISETLVSISWHVLGLLDTFSHFLSIVWCTCKYMCGLAILWALVGTFLSIGYGPGHL